MKILLAYIISSRGATVPANVVVESDEFPMSESEIRKHETKIRDAGGFDSVVITNVIPLREEVLK